MARPPLIENLATVSRWIRQEILSLDMPSLLRPRSLVESRRVTAARSCEGCESRRSRQLLVMFTIATESQAAFGIVRVGPSHGSRIPIGAIYEPREHFGTAAGSGTWDRPLSTVLWPRSP